MLVTLKRYLLDRIGVSLEKGYIFSLIDEMNISTVIDKTYMTYDHYIKHPMQAIAIKINMIIAENLHLINSPNRFYTHPLIRKDFHIVKVENQDLLLFISNKFYLNKRILKIMNLFIVLMMVNIEYIATFVINFV